MMLYFKYQNINFQKYGLAPLLKIQVEIQSVFFYPQFCLHVITILPFCYEVSSNFFTITISFFEYKFILYEPTFSESYLLPTTREFCSQFHQHLMTSFCLC